ncbi:unnamed protein product [Blepharisma stoltei]|uniref:Uncharacterized protein n=1 Tax=Blepharisma stoltei TaxID=1481888 RepID=A0AAU9IVN1_9CILI|nr:unnamed protein product [Blepharisma stoltei]
MANVGKEAALELEQATKSILKEPSQMKKMCSTPALIWVGVLFVFSFVLLSYPKRWAFILWAILAWGLCVMIHESGHAAMAKIAGHSHDSYLSMNFVKYHDHFSNFINPILLMLIPGWGVLGGPDYIGETSLIASGRPKRLLIVIGGILALFPVMIICVVGSWIEHNYSLGYGFALIAYLIVFSFLVNLLPLPYCDLFYFVYPELPDKFRAYVVLVLTHKYYKFAAFLLTLLVVYIFSTVFHDIAIILLRCMLVSKNSMNAGLSQLFFVEY